MAMLFATERLAVRAATLDDMDALLAIFGDPENVRHYNQGLPWTRTQVQELINHFAPAGVPSAVVTPGVVLLKPGNDVVGFGGVYYDAQVMDEAELAFIFRQEQWGKGLATEFVRAAIAAAACAGGRSPRTGENVGHDAVHRSERPGRARCCVPSPTPRHRPVVPAAPHAARWRAGVL